jgi:hypothetical protein
MRRLGVLCFALALGGCALGGQRVAAAGDAAVASELASAPASQAEIHRRYSEIVMEDQPVGYWRLDERAGAIAHDSSGHHLDGRIGAHVVLGRPGLIKDVRYSPEFLGADRSTAAEDIRVPRSPRLALTKDLTIEAWAFGYDLNVHGHNSGDITIVAYGNDTAPDLQHCRYALELDAHGHVLHFPTVVRGRFTDRPSGPRSLFHYLADQVGGDRRQIRELYAAAHSVANPPMNNRLYHLVGTYDGKTMRFYVNGELNNTMGVRGLIEGYTEDNGMGIGGEFANVNPTFFGRIAEVAVYDHPLSPERVKLHYLAGLDGTEATAVATEKTPANARLPALAAPR